MPSPAASVAKKDADRALGGVGLKGVFDVLAPGIVGAAADEPDVLAGHTTREEDAFEPIERVDVHGEDGDPLVVPFAVGAANPFQLRTRASALLSAGSG